MTPANRVAGAAPPVRVEERLVALYRGGIEGCRTEDARQVARVLMELIGLLNFGYREAAIRLFEVYDDCLQRVRRRQFQVPLRVLQNLEHAVQSMDAPAPGGHPSPPGED